MWFVVVSAGRVLVARVVRADRGLLTGRGEGRKGYCGWMW